jgi:hypothetical protein
MRCVRSTLVTTKQAQGTGLKRMYVCTKLYIRLEERFRVTQGGKNGTNESVVFASIRANPIFQKKTRKMQAAKLKYPFLGGVDLNCFLLLTAPFVLLRCPPMGKLRVIDFLS